MAASTDIKFYMHTNNNAPQLQNVYGSMINVLDACLVNGINIGAISSLTAVDKAVTAVFSSAHNLTKHQVIKITGATQSDFNGEHRILTVPNNTTITFELANTASASTGTGAIIASLPPLGWERPFGSTNASGGGKAAYRSKNLLLASRPFLRVVDELDAAYTTTYAKYAKVGIVEDMLDIDMMIGVQAPYDSASPDKNWIGSGSGASVINGWAKWYYARSAVMSSGNDTSGTIAAGSRSWILIGTSDYFYIMPTMILSNDQHACYGFGDFESYIPADTSNTFLSATNTYTLANNATAKDQYTPIANTNSYLILQKNYTQTAQANDASCTPLRIGAFPSGYSNVVATQAVSGQIPQTPIFINDGSLRGQLNGVNWLYQLRPYTHLQIVDFSEQSWVAVNTASGTSGVTGQLMLRIA